LDYRLKRIVISIRNTTHCLKEPNVINLSLGVFVEEPNESIDHFRVNLEGDLVECQFKGLRLDLAIVERV
jgi:hypothetical protein